MMADKYRISNKECRITRVGQAQRRRLRRVPHLQEWGLLTSEFWLLNSFSLYSAVLFLFTLRSRTIKLFITRDLLY